MAVEWITLIQRDTRKALAKGIWANGFINFPSTVGEVGGTSYKPRNTQKCGLQFKTVCVHLFINCAYSQEVWRACTLRWGKWIPFPTRCHHATEIIQQIEKKEVAEMHVRGFI